MSGDQRQGPPLVSSSSSSSTNPFVATYGSIDINNTRVHDKAKNEQQPDDDNNDWKQHNHQHRPRNIAGQQVPVNVFGAFDDVEDVLLTPHGVAPILSPLQEEWTFQQATERHQQQLGHCNDEESSEISPLLMEDEEEKERTQRGSCESSEHKINSNDIHLSSSSVRSSRRSRSIPKEIVTGDNGCGMYGPSTRDNHHHHHHHPMYRSQGFYHTPLSSGRCRGRKVLMTELAKGDDDDFHVDNKYILLEDLGTASSWLVLLLPYLAFVVSLLVQFDSTVLDVTLRIVLVFATTAFLIYWMRTVRVQQCCDWRQSKRSTLLWWEDPWVLFPERYYIAFMLLAQIMVLDPFQVIFLLDLEEVEQSSLEIAADICAGIGLQALLMAFLCLFQGLRYHTANRAKRRAEQQRKILQLRRAVKYVSDNNGKQLQCIESPQAIADFYDDYGDVDGGAFTGNIRLPSDPFAAELADFLLPKVALLLTSIVAVTLEAFCRAKRLDNETIHAMSSLVRCMAMLVWVYLTAVAAMSTGSILNRQPFLGTRSAQLAYSVLMAHGLPYIGALLVFLTLHFVKFFHYWRGSSAAVIGDEPDRSYRETLILALDNLSTIGIASTMGFGAMLCIAIQVFTTAFIFLPAHSMDTEDGDDTNKKDQTEVNTMRKSKRDKRLVVLLARDSKTWRIFPCPIERCHEKRSPPLYKMYHLCKDFSKDFKTNNDRGLVSIGPYVPVFCAELACWLQEASWQAYYTPIGMSREDTEKSGDFEGWMRLDTIGLLLEGYVYDERTNTQAYIATNSEQSVDGEEDSIIVVGFRGTANAKNMHTDLRYRQVPLLDQLAGIGPCPFRIFPDRIDICSDDRWIWDTESLANDDNSGGHVKCVSCWTQQEPPCSPSVREPHPSQDAKRSRSDSFDMVEGAKIILQATPVARETFPMVHEGFQEVYGEIRKKLINLLLPVLQRQLEKSLQTCSHGKKEPLALPKIYCTGHSMGGSVAQLFAQDLAANCEFVLPGQRNLDPAHSYQSTGPGSPWNAMNTRQPIRLTPPIACYTYGQPRVGNRAFARRYKHLVPHTFRVVNEGDVVTTIPHYLCCGGVYKHAGLEVVLDQGMTGNILVGPTVVETLFRFHKIRTNVSAHQLARYRDCLECSFDRDELMEYYRGRNVMYKDLHVNSPGESGSGRNKQDEEQPSRRRLSTAEFPGWLVSSSQKKELY